jgi:hypothetical protein
VAKNNPKEWCVYTFSRADKTSYIEESLEFEDFKGGKAELFSFHEQGKVGEALRTEIDIFASQLSDYMWALTYKEKDGARPLLRDAIRDPQNPIQALLDVVKANYN